MIKDKITDKVCHRHKSDCKNAIDRRPNSWRPKHPIAPGVYQQQAPSDQCDARGPAEQGSYCNLLLSTFNLPSHENYIRLSERLTSILHCAKMTADIHKKDGSGSTVLHIAAERCPDKIILCLLNKNADIEATNALGMPARS